MDQYLASVDAGTMGAPCALVDSGVGPHVQVVEMADDYGTNDRSMYFKRICA